MSKRSIADCLVETLIAAGVKRVFGVVGDSLNGILEEIGKRKEIEWIPVRHEETGAFAAGAQAHLTGELAVCAGSCGPGNMHLINGLYDCHRSRVPVLAIAAHIPSSEIGSSYFQETHPDQLFKDCSHYCELISQPEQMPRVLEIAIQTALARQGVSVVAIPGDIALKRADFRKPSASIKRVEPLLRPSAREVSALADLLNQSKTVTILAGAGCAGAHEELMEVAERLKAPIVTTLRGRECVEYDNPYDRSHGADWLFFRLPRDDGMRDPADAGHGFSLYPVLSAEGDDNPGGPPGREPGTKDAPGYGPHRGCEGNAERVA
jgi:pyruvate dehydrogenase (quinone)